MKPQSRAEKIQAELKLLEWHKLANHSAIKVARNCVFELLCDHLFTSS